MEYTKGELVEHRINGEYLMVLKRGQEQYLCRTKDMREVWFYDFELRALKSAKNS